MNSNNGEFQMADIQPVHSQQNSIDTEMSHSYMSPEKMQISARSRKSKKSNGPKKYGSVAKFMLGRSMPELDFSKQTEIDSSSKK